MTKSLRERLAEQEADQARERVAPLVQDLERATAILHRAARNAERLAIALRWQRSAVMATAAFVLVAVFLTALPSHWWLSSTEQRQLAWGQRLERAWISLGDEDRAELTTLLGLQTDP